MSLFTERRARKHVTETRRRTPPAVFRPELQNMDHMKHRSYWEVEDSLPALREDGNKWEENRMHLKSSVFKRFIFCLFLRKNKSFMIHFHL